MLCCRGSDAFGTAHRAHSSMVGEALAAMAHCQVELFVVKLSVQLARAIDVPLLRCDRAIPSSARAFSWPRTQS